MAKLRLGREVGDQWLIEGEGRVVVLLRLRQPAGCMQQNAQVDMATGQFIAELGAGGEVGDQLLAENQSFIVALLRLLLSTGVTQQIAQVAAIPC